ARDRRRYRHRLHPARDTAARRRPRPGPAHRRRPRHAAPSGGAGFRGLVRRPPGSHPRASRPDRGDALMWVLGLTGSIATGKSTVAKMFARRGIPVFSSDDAVHELYRGEAVAPVEAL